MSQDFCSLPRLAAALTVATALLVSSAGAFDIKKGALVLRSGKANEASSYKNESTDSNEKLQGVSALCSNGNSTKVKSKDLIKTDKSKSGLFQNDYGATQVSTILSAGGSVASKPLKKNPNHCEISGLTVEKLKGVWSMCTAAAGC
jgi:hypothetical protein